MTPQIKRRIEQIKRGEVPTGYKKTKAGIVPEDWEVTKLGTLFSERNETKCQNLELLSITGNRGVIPRSQVEGKDNSSEDKSKYKHICVGDIGYNTMRMWQGVSALSQYDGIVSPAYTILSPSSNACAAFYSYCFKMTNTINTFYRHSQGLVDDTRSLKYEWFKNIDYVHPPLPEQEKIAEILIAQDKVIALKEKLLEEKKKQKKYLMQQLLTGKKRLPGFSGDWEKVKLRDCIVEIDERSTESGQYEILSVTKNGIEKQVEHFNQQIASKDNSGYKIIKYNQLAFSILNLWMGSLGVLKTQDIGIVSPAYKVYDFTKKMLPDFGKHYLRSHNIVWLYNINSEIGASVVRKNLNLVSLMNCYVSIPAIIEQKQIALVIDSCDQEIAFFQKSIYQERQKKKALMQLLLTGIVRV